MGQSSGLSDQDRINNIRKVINEDGERWRRRFPILANNNVMGMGILLTAIVGMGLGAYGYFEWQWSPWWVVPFVAFFSSVSHELEHDLIHWQYFKNNKVIHNLMMLAVWIMRPGTMNPWLRRHLHFLHHKTSGTEQDLEERGISNGMKYGPMRFVVMMDTFLGNLVKVVWMAPKGRKWKAVSRLLFANLPLAYFTVVVWYSVLMFHGANGVAALMGSSIAWNELWLSNMGWMTDLVIVWIGPFYLRSFSINFISSNMHYYGNVNNLLQQCQVLNHPIFWPLQLFCFNFGSSHAIHHFVVREPFYIRQLTVKAAHRVMRDNGVRFNDFGTFARGNNYRKQTQLHPA